MLARLGEDDHRIRLSVTAAQGGGPVVEPRDPSSARRNTE